MKEWGRIAALLPAAPLRIPLRGNGGGVEVAGGHLNYDCDDAQ